jgi:glucose-6-phosphate 1-dehydrogenase
VTLGRKNLDSESYRAAVCNGNCSDGFISNHNYELIDLEKEEVCEHCNTHFSKDDTNYFYSALPPENTKSVIKYIGKLKREGYKVMLLIEKPFGSNLQEAIELKELIEKENLSGQVLISDHYLFKKEVLALTSRPFKKVKIVSLEEVGLENRGGYYNSIGALKDMIQSHFLNIFFKLSGNGTNHDDFEVISYERGQYSDYEKDLGRPSETETFVKIMARVGDREIEFLTGKKLGKKHGYISIDEETIQIDHSDNSYIRLFREFFAGGKENFSSIDSSILGWKIIERIEKEKSDLNFYNEGQSVDHF